MLQKILYLGLAGAMGTLARYGLAGFFNKINGSPFPYGTLVVNLVGCFFAGLLWTLFEHRWPVTAETRLLILVGFMGAFTTFSTFILESGELVRSAQWISAAANVTLQNGLGFVALFIGVSLGRLASWV